MFLGNLLAQSLNYRLNWLKIEPGDYVPRESAGSIFKLSTKLVKD